MKTHLRRWGNSAAVPIPAAMLDTAGLKLDDSVVVSAEGGRIVIELPSRKIANLQALVDQITPENLHNETDWGPAQGKEVW